MKPKDRGVHLAIEAAGSVQQLADAIGVRRQAIYLWKRIPIERVPAVMRATGIPARLLRPDLYEFMRVWER